MDRRILIYRIAPREGTDDAAFERLAAEQVLPAVDRGFGRAGNVTGTSLLKQVQGDGETRYLWLIEFSSVGGGDWVHSRIEDALQKMRAIGDAELVADTAAAS